MYGVLPSRRCLQGPHKLEKGTGASALVVAMRVPQSPRLSAAVSDLGAISPVTETRLLTLLPRSDMIQTGLKPRDHGNVGEGEGREGGEGRR